MFRKIILSVFVIGFVTIVSKSLTYFRASYFQSSMYSSFQRFIHESNLLKTVLSSYQEFNGISDTLNKVEIFSEEGLVELQKTHAAFQNLWMTLNSTREYYTEYEQTVQEKVGNLGQTLAELNASYTRIREASQNIPFDLLYESTEKVFKEKSLQILRLSDQYANCSIQQEILAGEIERTELEKNMTLFEIESLEKLIRSQTSLLRKSFTSLDITEKELIEYFKEIKINIQEINNSELLRVLVSSEKRIKEINEILIKLDSQTGDLGSAQINHFILVLDHSGSMEGEKWNQVKRSVEYFIEANKHHGLHVISIIVFETSAYTHLKAQKFFEYVTPENYAWGGTNYDAAMQAVQSTIPLSKARPIVLFLTDGVPTNSVRTNSILDNIHANHGQRGLMFFGFGVGQFNYGILSELTKRANAGNEYFVNEKGKIQFLHTAHDEKVIHEVFLKISDIVKHSGQDIDEKIRLLRNEKITLIKEALKVIWSLQKTKLSIFERKESLTVIRKLEQKISLLLIENELIQTHIKRLSSRISQLSVISSSKLKILKETYASQKLQCSRIQTDFLKIQKEREALGKVESVGVEADLIERCEKFVDSRQKFINFTEPLINKLYLRKSLVYNSLKSANFSFVREKIFSNANFYLRQVFNKTEDYCQESADCLYKIFMDFFQNQHFESYFSKSELLSVIFTHATNVEFFLADETEEQVILILQEAIESLTQKRTSWSWSFTSFIKWVVKKIFFSNQTFQESMREEMLQKEVQNIREMFYLIKQEVKERYERFTFSIWKSEHEKIIKEFSKNFQEILS